MTSATGSAPSFAKTDLLPLSLLNDYIYCERRAALKLLDRLRAANEHTAWIATTHHGVSLPAFGIAHPIAIRPGIHFLRIPKIL
jgi:hypothetical protein